MFLIQMLVKLRQGFAHTLVLFIATVKDAVLLFIVSQSTDYFLFHNNFIYSIKYKNCIGLNQVLAVRKYTCGCIGGVSGYDNSLDVPALRGTV